MRKKSWKKKIVKKFKKLFKRKKRRKRSKSLVKKIKKVLTPKKFKIGELVRIPSGFLFGAKVKKIDDIILEDNVLYYIVEGEKYTEDQLEKNEL